MTSCASSQPGKWRQWVRARRYSRQLWYTKPGSGWWAARSNIEGHSANPPGVAFSPDGLRLASVSKDRTLKVWDSKTGDLVWEGGPLTGQGQSASYSPDGRWLATAGYDSLLVTVWDAQNGRQILALDTAGRETLQKGLNSIDSAEFSPDGRLLATAGVQGVTLWSLSSHAPDGAATNLQAQLLRTLAGQSSSLVFAPDSSRLTFYNRGGSNYGVFVWDAPFESMPRLITTNISQGAERLRFTPDNRCVVSVDTNQAIFTINVITGQKISSFPTTDPQHPSEWRSGLDQVPMRSRSPSRADRDLIETCANEEALN